ncbi:AAA family ATPase [bacterium]|nr:AAA family ATPase [bacterium]
MEFWIIIIAIMIGYNIFKKKKKTYSPGQISATRMALVKRGIGKRRSSRTLADIKKPDDFDLTKEKQEVIDILENTSSNVFLTGKAGTGKSKFLEYFRATTEKNVAVLAFTGVAAINVQGQTIHSFFKFNPQTTIDSIKARWGDDAKIYKKIDTIIIDEISMVRADLLDFIDKFMRLNGRHSDEPFGGVQILAIGDLFQLPPIVTRDEERFFTEVYRSPYFFDSNVYQQAGFVKKELTEVYRQNKEEQNDFIKTLDNLRVCSFDENDIDLINTRFDPAYEKPENELIISLVPTNNMANSINMGELSKLSSKPHIYTGVITGEFQEKNLPTAQELVLKEGSQIMLLNNDSRKRWFNGDIVKIIKTDPYYVRVLFDDGTFNDVTDIKWDSIKFIFDEETQKIQPEVIGSFTQLPIKLAWAVTIHKGQGKTFDKVHIDFGNGTFTPGQAYVALSRCQTLEGMVLTSPLEENHVFTDSRIKEFMNIKDKKIKSRQEPF